MARKRATLTDLLNNLTFRITYDKIRLLSESAFEWDGLPEFVKPKYIERYLFQHGKAIFFYDPKIGHRCLEAQDLGKFNINHESLYYRAIGFQYNKTYKADVNCVIIDNNPMRKATHDFVMFYVNKLTEAERTMDVNIKRCKTPWVFACDQNDVLTVKRMFDQIDGNVPAIFADKRLDLNSLALFKTEAKFLGNELMDYKKSVENELLTFLGFDNLAVDKKERVNLSEANSNNEITDSFADLQLKSRQEACEKINKMFELNVSVKRKEVVNNVDNSDARHNKADS